MKLNPKALRFANQKSLSKLITISGYKIMMTEKEEPKTSKHKKMKEMEKPKILATP